MPDTAGSAKVAVGPAPAAAPRPDPRALAPAGVVLVVLAAMMCAVFEVLLVPLYWNSVIIPISIPLAIASNIALPVMARRFADSGLIGALPIVAWIAVVLLASQSGPGGDVLLPGNGAMGKVAIGMMLAGLSAGVITVYRTETLRIRAAVRARRV